MVRIWVETYHAFKQNIQRKMEKYFKRLFHPLIQGPINSVDYTFRYKGTVGRRTVSKGGNNVLKNFSVSIGCNIKIHKFNLNSDKNIPFIVKEIPCDFHKIQQYSD